MSCGFRNRTDPGDRHSPGVGAPQPRLLRQFLVESILLSCNRRHHRFGLGAGASVGITKLINALSSGTEWPWCTPCRRGRRPALFQCRGRFFGFYPRSQGQPARSHRGTALRIRNDVNLQSSAIRAWPAAERAFQVEEFLPPGAFGVPRLIRARGTPADIPSWVRAVPAPSEQ